MSQSFFESKIFPIKVKGKVIILNRDSIESISADGDYAEIKTKDKKYVIRESLNKINRDISQHGFIRIHRSTIVNILSISELIFSNYGEIDVKLKNGDTYRVGRSYKENLKTKLNI